MTTFGDKLRETAFVRVIVDGCVSDPFECDVTTTHPSSSYGIPVLVVRRDWADVGLTAGQALGPADIHSVRYYGQHRDALIAAGYQLAAD